jgi:hypothetical protein
VPKSRGVSNCTVSDLLDMGPQGDEAFTEMPVEDPGHGGGRTVSLLCLALRAPQSPQLRWVPGDTAYLWGKPLAPSEAEGNSGRGENSPIGKPEKRPAREPRYRRKGLVTLA